MFLPLSSDLFQQASFHPCRQSGPLCLPGPWATTAWLPSAVFQIKARFRGEIHQSRAGQEKLGICSFKGMHIHIKMQFLSEILKSI